jgi:hypothetical protein
VCCKLNRSNPWGRFADTPCANTFKRPPSRFRHISCFGAIAVAARASLESSPVTIMTTQRRTMLLVNIIGDFFPTDRPTRGVRSLKIGTSHTRSLVSRLRGSRWSYSTSIAGGNGLTWAAS